ncbi:MAG: hypothetical protein ACRD5J_16520 [Nitrososphaeraceae archaeon]
MKRATEKSIKVRDETHKRLLKRGTAGDTMDSVITELLDITEEKTKK